MSDIGATKKQTVPQGPTNRKQLNSRGTESTLDRLLTNGRAGVAYCTVSATPCNALQHPLQHSVQQRRATEKNWGKQSVFVRLVAKGLLKREESFFHREPRNAVKYNIAWRVAEGVAVRVAVGPY